MKCDRRSAAAQRVRLATGLVPVMVACAAFAASDGEHREHEAHEHGHGALEIVLDGEELLIELRIPAVNVVGFEHAPGDDSEREAIRQALVPFGNAAMVIGLPAEAECAAEETDAEIHGMAHEGEHDGEGHEGEEHRRESDAHAEHEDDEHDAEREMEAHSELHATYRFHCHEPDRLDRIEVRAFEYLLDAEEIDVRVVTPAAQMATELHPGSTVVEMSP